MELETMERRALRTRGVVRLLSMSCDEVELGPVDAHVVNMLPLNVDLVIGLDVIARVGLSVRGNSHGVDVTFNRRQFAYAGIQKTLTVEDTDFSAWFDGEHWTVKWVWSESQGSDCRGGNYESYIREDCQDEFDSEMKQWIDDGVLILHDCSRHGPVQRYLPLLAVQQEKGGLKKVRPVMDYRALNKCIESHPGGATPACADRLRQWRQLGSECSVLDLKKAYLQVFMDPSLWTQQAIRWNGEVYLLTRLGFGLSCAPKILTAIIDKVLEQDSVMREAVTGYIDDLFIDERKVSSSDVKGHLSKWGLQTKEPERLGSSSVRILGMRVGEDMRWSRDRDLPSIESNTLSRRQAHSILGSWLGHFPVAGWLRVACGYLQRCMAKEDIAWDDVISPETVVKLKDTYEKIKKEGDPVKGSWPVSPDGPVVVWADASSLAVGVALEISGEVVEDASWLRPDSDSAHINRAELDAVLRGVNMALRWGRRQIKVMTDSATVCGWLKATIERTHNIRSRALGEVLIRRRLQTLQEIIAQEGLTITVNYVRSAENQADALTRVPKCWLKAAGKTEGRGMAAAGGQVVSLEDIRVVHDRCHFGVDRTLQLARERFGDNVSRRMVRKVVSRCHRCARIDPARNFNWEHGAITANRLWERLAVDVTHFGGKPYLSVIDVASRFTIWRSLRNESGGEIASQLLSIFSEFGPPESLLSDNGTAFRSREVRDMLNEWSIRPELSCAYRPQGNAVIERVHRTVKRSAARTRRGIEEAVFWLNCTRTEQQASPFELLFSARSKKPGVSDHREEIPRPPLVIRDPVATTYDDFSQNPFTVGNRVYLRSPDGRCDSEWSGPHRVTSVLSSVSVEINDDGIARHVSHLRAVPSDCLIHSDLDNGHVGVQQRDFLESDSEVTSEITDSETEDNGGNSDGPNLPLRALRRSSRTKRRPNWWNDYDVGIN